MTKPFKIWVEDKKTLEKVAKQMDKDGIRWANGSWVSHRIDLYNAPIALFVDSDDRLTWSNGERFKDPGYSEITPEEYLKESKTTAKSFKILIKDVETYKKVTKRMDEEGIRWWASGDLPSDSYYTLTFFPVYLCVDGYSRLAWSASSDTDVPYSEITPEEYLKENKTMTKADLKDWMIVTDNEGRKYIVDRVHEVLLEYGAVDKVNQVLVLDNFTDDLHLIDDDFYITRVFEPSEMQLSHIFDGDACLSSMDLIWIRQTPSAVEMTVAEIEEKLGIKNLKIVEG